MWTDTCLTIVLCSVAVYPASYITQYGDLSYRRVPIMLATANKMSVSSCSLGLAGSCLNELCQLGRKRLSV